MKRILEDDLVECGNTFYCPQGHPIHFSRSWIVAEYRCLEREVVYQQDIIRDLRKSIQALRGIQTRYRNKLLKGYCPYCKHTPTNMSAHMKNAHSSDKGNR